MKLTAKVLSLILFITMLAALPIQSYAADGYDVTVSIGNVKGSAGEVVDVPVKIDQLTKEVAAYGIEINFNKEQVKVVGIKSGYGGSSATCSEDEKGCFYSNIDNDKGFLRAAWADPSAGNHPIKEGIELFTVQLEILKTDFTGTSHLTVQADDKEALSFFDAANQPLSVGMETGKLDIVSTKKEESPSKAGDAVTKTDSKTSHGGSLPKTGDDSYIDMYLNIGIAVIAAILGLMWFSRKRQKADQSN